MADELRGGTGPEAGDVDLGNLPLRGRTQPSPARRRLRAAVKLLAALLCAFIAFEAQGIGMIMADEVGLDLDLGASVVGALAAALLLAALGGARMLPPTRRSLAQAWDLCWWPIVISGFTMAMGLVSVGLGQQELVADWPARALYLVVLCAGIGLFEEAVFRGMVSGGLQGMLGGTRAGLIVATLLSALIFGALHIDWTALDYSAQDQVAQALLKVLQAGLLGFVFGACMVRSRSVGGVAAMHALDDFLLLFPTIALGGGALTTEYVAADAQAASASIVSYVIACVLYLPPAIAAWQQLRRAEVPDFGCLAPAGGAGREPVLA